MPDAFEQQLESLETATQPKVDKKIINVWNRFKEMGSLELSTLSPFAVVFVLTSQSILKSLGEEGFNTLSDIKWYRIDLKGIGKKIAFPIGATKNIFETINFSGGIALNNFEIGYEGSLKQLKGSFTFDILSLDEFENNFVASSLLSPYNLLLTIHGHSGANIWVDLPFNLENGEEWKTQIESQNPGLWSVNLCSLIKRNFNPTDNGYSCQCDIIQHSTTKSGSSSNTQTNQDFKNYSQQNQVYIAGSTKSIFDKLIDKTKIISNLNNVYKSNNYDYILNKLSNTWFNSQEDFIQNYSFNRTNEDGKSEYIYDTILYPLGLVCESIISSHYEKNPHEPIMTILYEDVGKLNLPPFKFSIYNGEETKTFELPIQSTFDIPIAHQKVERLLQMPDTQWKEALYGACELVNKEYRLLYKGINKTIENSYFNMSFEFAEQKIDREINERAPLDEDNDMIFEYRAKNSLIGNIGLESSSINLESIAALGYGNILGKRNSVFLDKDVSQNKEINSVETKQPTNEDEIFSTNLNDTKEGDDVKNAELLINLYGDDSASRGFLIRLFSQILTIETHGISGLLPMQICWVRGLTKGLNGKHVIWSINERVDSNSYTTSLKLINLSFTQDVTGIQDNTVNKTEESDNKQTTTIGETTDKIFEKK